VTNAPSTHTGSDINVSDENVLFDLLNKTTFLIFLIPRFTAEEKEVLYTLFHLHEEVIDIKHRKKQRNKYSVRETWDKIVKDFNSHPHVSAMRNIKQIQKFWLNSRCDMV